MMILIRFRMWSCLLVDSEFLAGEYGTVNVGIRHTKKGRLRPQYAAVQYFWTSPQYSHCGNIMTYRSLIFLTDGFLMRSATWQITTRLRERSRFTASGSLAWKQANRGSWCCRRKLFSI